MNLYFLTSKKIYMETVNFPTMKSLREITLDDVVSWLKENNLSKEEIRVILNAYAESCVKENFQSGCYHLWEWWGGNINQQKWKCKKCDKNKFTPIY